MAPKFSMRAMLAAIAAIAIALALVRPFLWNRFPIVMHDMVTCRRDFNAFDSQVTEYLLKEGFAKTTERPTFIAPGHAVYDAHTQRLFRKTLKEGADCFVYVYWDGQSRSKREYPVILEIGARVTTLPWQHAMREEVKQELRQTKQRLTPWCREEPVTE